MKQIPNEATRRLYEAVLKLKTEEECDAFFEDICTIKEIQDLSQRLWVASLLNEGKGYQDISSVTGASTATICRVNKCLNYGRGGYRVALAQKREVENK